jgi:predicted amidohydrolase
VPDVLRVAVVQFGAEPGDVATNLDAMRRFLARAQDGGADIAVFPELCLSGYVLDPAAYTAELLADVERAETSLAAAAASTAIVYGAPVRVRDGLANATVLVRPDKTRTVYAKTHMDVKERRVFAPGAEFVAADGVGLACCYDLAFPEPARILALAGALALLVPMAWEVERGFVMERVVAARAVENVAYVVCANQTGVRGAFRFRGASCVVDPVGERVLSMGAEENLAVVELDLARVDALRAQLDSTTYPLLVDRRPELYSPVAQ